MTSPHKTRSSKRFAPIIALFAALLLLSACGSTATATNDNANDSADSQTVASLPEAAPDDTPDSSDDSDAAANSSTEEASEDGADLSPEEAQLKFEQCLEDAGIDSPFSSADGEAIVGAEGDEGGQVLALDLNDDESFEAFEKCNEIMSDAFGEFTPSPEQDALMQDAELEFSRCMAEQGFDVSTDGGIELDADLDISDLDAAASECDSAFDTLNDAFEDEGSDQ